MFPRSAYGPLIGVFIVVGSAVFVLYATAPSLPAALPVIGAPIPAVQTIVVPPPPPVYQYIAIEEGCGPAYGESCVRGRSGPGTDYPVVARFRIGTVLKVADSIERDGHTWYRVVFDEWLRYPERAKKIYVAADRVSAFSHVGPEELGATASTTKRIIVDRSSQMLYAYDGDTLVIKAPVSTGITATPTPRGNFRIFLKTPSRYMQGPIPGISTHEYDLPGVPWDMYFTAEGAAIHGAYWHDDFGKPHSNGCVNLSYDDAKQLYAWADIGTPVTVRD